MRISKSNQTKINTKRIEKYEINNKFLNKKKTIFNNFPIKTKQLS